MRERMSTDELRAIKARHKVTQDELAEVALAHKSAIKSWLAGAPIDRHAGERIRSWAELMDRIAAREGKHAE